MLLGVWWGGHRSAQNSPSNQETQMSPKSSNNRTRGARGPPVVGPWGSPVMVIPKGPAVLHCIWWCQDLQSGAAVRSFLLRIRLSRCGTTGPFQRDCHRSKWHLWVNHHHNLYIPNETIDRCNFGVPSSDRPVWLSSIGMTRGFDRPLGSWPITVVLSFRTKSMSILDCELPHKNQILLK